MHFTYMNTVQDGLLKQGNEVNLINLVCVNI